MTGQPSIDGVDEVWVQLAGRQNAVDRAHIWARHELGLADAGRRLDLFLGSLSLGSSYSRRMKSSTIASITDISSDGSKSMLASTPRLPGRRAPSVTVPDVTVGC